MHSEDGTMTAADEKPVARERMMGPDGKMMGGACGQNCDMGRMCETHRQMTSGKSPAERQAAVEEHIKSMHGSVTPEMVAHHSKMMEMHCGPDASQTK